MHYFLHIFITTTITGTTTKSYSFKLDQCHIFYLLLSCPHLTHTSCCSKKASSSQNGVWLMLFSILRHFQGFPLRPITNPNSVLWFPRSCLTWLIPTYYLTPWHSLPSYCVPHSMVFSQFPASSLRSTPFHLRDYDLLSRIFFLTLWVADSFSCSHFRLNITAFCVLSLLLM